MDRSKIARLREALEKIRRIDLVTGPTPVRKLARAFPDSEVWLKDDSISHPVYGGNKPRKLEYLIAKAQDRRQSVVTFGFESSNHAVATAYHCHQNNVPCHLILVRGPDGMSPADEKLKQQKLELMREFASSIETVESFSAATRKGMARWVRGFGSVRLVSPGGSNALGSLGYVRAALELVEQVERGECPLPSGIYVPLGTGGTVAGLASGLAACGVATRVHAVKVVPGPVNELPRLRWLARQMHKLLPKVDFEAFMLANVTIESDALGKGYGAPTQEGLRAVDRWIELEKIKLEATYSAKAAAVLERHVSMRQVASPAMFWLTYSEFRKA